MHTLFVRKFLHKYYIINKIYLQHDITYIIFKDKRTIQTKSQRMYIYDCSNSYQKIISMISSLPLRSDQESMFALLPIDIGVD